MKSAAALTVVIARAVPLDGLTVYRGKSTHRGGGVWASERSAAVSTWSGPRPRSRARSSPPTVGCAATSSPTTPRGPTGRRPRSISSGRAAVWNLPTITGTGTTCLVRVSGYTSGETPVGADVSDAFFTIRNVP